MTTGWKTVKLGTLCRIAMGGTPPRSSARYFDQSKTSGHVWLSIADLPTSGNKTVVDSKEYLSDEGAARVRVVPAGTLLVSFKLSLGRLAFAGCDLRTNEAIAALSELDEQRVSKEYLYWYLTRFDWQKAAEGEDKIKGKTLNKAKLEQIEIVYPPLAEQQRIVAILDQAFEGIDAANKAAQQARSDAVALRKLHLSNSFREAVLTFGTVPLSSLCTFENGDRGENYPNKSARTDSGIPFVNAGHLSERRIDMSSMDYIAPERFDLLRSGKPQDGDVLFCLRGSLGKFGVVRGVGPCAIASSLVIVRPRGGTSSDYIAAYFGSDLCAEMIDGHRSGTAQPNLGAKQLAAFAIPPLTTKDQAQLVSLTDAVASECGRAVEVYDQKLALLAELKQSILARAFSGELTRESLAA